MIEGQPQQHGRKDEATEQFSGLVIEGQPQRARCLHVLELKFSGLVIEGQPQRHGIDRQSTT